MDEQSIERWTAHPDVCRCCLSTKGIWDLTKSYDATDRDNEQNIFSDILQETYAVKLSHLSEWDHSHLICDSCLGQLRDAYSFRKQVLKAEQYYEEYYETKKDEQTFPIIIKCETISNEDFSDSFQEDNESPEENKNDHTTEPEHEIEKPKTIMSRKRPAIVKSNRKKKKFEKFDEFDSDTSVDDRPKKKKKKKRKDKNFEQNTKTSVDMPPPKSKEQRTSYAKNNNLRKNMTLLLKNTTIIPFKSRHNTNGNFSCHYCDENFSPFEDLRRHVRDKHADITEKKIMASVKYPVDFVKAEVSEIQCKLCEKLFQNLETVTEHLVGEHKEPYQQVTVKPTHGILSFILTSGQLKCHICEMKFRRFRHLYTHMSEHCENFVCETCGKNFLVYKSLIKHVHRHSKHLLKCTFCERSFKSPSGLNYHMRVEHNYGGHKCTKCNKVFKQKEEKADHLEQIHKIQKPSYFCKLCSKAFASYLTFGRHMESVHWKEKKYICKTCGKSVATLVSLYQHTRIHTGERPYECKVCSKTFINRSGYTRHLKIHTK